MKTKTVTNYRGILHHKHKTWRLEKLVSRKPLLYEIVGIYNSVGEIADLLEIPYFNAYKIKISTEEQRASKYRIYEVI